MMMLWMFGCWNRDPDLVEIAVPRTDLAPGHVISAEDLYPLSTAAELLGRDTVLRSTDLVGRSVVARLLRSEPVRAERLDAAPSATWTARTRLVSDADDVALDVVVTTRDIEAGQVITEGDVQTIRARIPYIPEHVFLWERRVVGQTACDRMLADEVVRVERLIDPVTSACVH
ncbi:MAG: SAF domain-containing protein [Alphaproteobacteria bacterium]|nr:SAF domain-containing protein [Alphaproteobacteria bacterium]MCB9695900.1 SAF domain-containing protein [Alphaproteobacteria bacterium]